MAATATSASPTPAPVGILARARSAVAELWPKWSTDAAYRALRATVVIPALFAIGIRVLHNEQIGLFASFGGVATLVLAPFGGQRRNKLLAHIALAVCGSVLIVIGTAVSSSTALAAVATVPVAFVVLFAGVAGPNAAIGATAVMLAYVLPAATLGGTMSMVPTRLAGWWMASVAGTLAVLLLAPRPVAPRLRTAAATSAAAIADEVDLALAGNAGPGLAERVMATKDALVTAFTAAPYRPTGLAAADQALARLVENLEWCSTSLNDLTHEVGDIGAGSVIDRELLGAAAVVLRDTSQLLNGADVRPDVEDLERTALDAHAAASLQGGLGHDGIHVAFHARVIAAAARSVADDALIVDRRVDASLPQLPPGGGAGMQGRVASRAILLWTAWRQVAKGHANPRSVWFLNSARGAIALAAAVAVADLTNVQHGFWVVLGALSVLRTSAASTGATALRAVGGTIAGFLIGAALILAIGTHTVTFWAVLPVAVLVTSYTPGTAPFAVGQAAFTLFVSLLFNIVQPIGWRVGVIRVEDVALGVGVSAVVGVLFWPRGAASVVRDDLGDAFHRGGVFLVQATAWALGVRTQTPEAGAEATDADSRLDQALRALLAEQGTKRVPREQLWRLVAGAQRVRMTAQLLTGLSPPDLPDDPTSWRLVEEAVELAGQCDALAARLGRMEPSVATELTAAALDHGPIPRANGASRAEGVRQHLLHVRTNLAELVAPADAVAARWAVPWWR